MPIVSARVTPFARAMSSASSSNVVPRQPGPPPSPADPPVLEMEVPWAGAPTTVTYTDSNPAGKVALVCMHGAPGSVRDFRYLVPQLEANPELRVIRLNMPGHAGTTLPSVPDAYSDLPQVAGSEGSATMVLAVLQRLGVHRAVVLGHSLGMATALTAAGRAPETIVGLVGVNPSTTRIHQALQPWWAIGKLQWLVANLPLVSGFTKKMLWFAWTKLYGFSPKTPVEEIYAAQARLTGTHWESMPDYAANCKLHELPALVAYSLDDPLIEPACYEDLVKALDAKDMIFSHGGHYLVKRGAGEIAEEIEALMKQVMAKYSA